MRGEERRGGTEKRESTNKGKEMPKKVECPAGNEVTPLARTDRKKHIVRPQ